MHLQGRSQQVVLGDAGRRKIADGVERRPADDRRGAAADGDAPGVAGRLHGVEEEPLLVRIGTADPEIVLDRIGVEEVLRGLHQPDKGIVEQGEGADQEVPVGNEIRIEHGDEIRAIGALPQPCQHVIDIARLAILVVRPGHMLDARDAATLGQPLSPPIVKHMDLPGLVVTGQGPGNGALENRPLLVVGRDQDRHARRLPLVPLEISIGLGRPIGVAGQDGESRNAGDDGGAFKQGERPADGRIQRPAEGGQRLRQAPVEVPGSQKHRDGEHEQPCRGRCAVEQGHDERANA